MKKCNTDNIKGGDFYSRFSVGKVLSSVGGGFKIANEDGEDWTIDKDIVAGEFYIAGQYDTEVAVTRTEMAKILKASPRLVFVVNYHKQTKVATVVDAIAEQYPNQGGSIQSKAAFKKNVKDAQDTFMKGEERTLIGYTEGYEDDFGRIRVIDLEQPKEITDNGYDKRYRLVDPRTLNSLIIYNIKYIIK